MAHDFNNLLTIINGYCDVLIGRLKPDDPTIPMLEEIRTAGLRANALTGQLLAFGRRQVLAPKVLDLNAVVIETERMLRRLIGEDIVLETELESSIPPVKADAGQLQQVLLNLATNARDAMPRGGRLTIATRRPTIDQTEAGVHPPLRPGEHVVLEVTDTGAGMLAETQAHIFQPFFTTKQPGKGTGLGLAVVHGIVTQSGGHIAVRSKPGKGTTFEILLPSVSERSPAGSSAQDLVPLPRGTETILLAEDEAAVRALARHILHESGYQVLEAPDGLQAVSVAEQYPGSIHLLISDVVMPHLGGRQLAEQLLKTKPDMKVLFLSGYTDDAIVRHGVSENEYAFLPKPFTPAALAQKVRQVLDRGPSTHAG